VIYDAIVAGLGGMGSAVLARCAMRGASVLGIEQFGPAHDRGASAGKTRMIRQAYYEDPAYVPLLFRAYDLWRDVEVRTSRQLLKITGLLMTGPETGEIVLGSSRTAREYDLIVEYLSAADVRRRFPVLNVRDEEVAVFEREGGVVFPERAIRAHLDLARQAGAQARFDVAINAWRAEDDGVVVELADGTRVQGRALVLTMGPWLNLEFARIGVPLQIQRKVQVWFTPRIHAYDAGAFPAFLLERSGLPAALYGFPDFGDGVKAAFHGSGELTQPQQLDRGIDRVRDVEPVAAALDSWMPQAAGEYREGKACMYAMTADGHFVVDRHPAHSNVVLMGGFSGHGFKFASVMGEVGADLALEGATRYDIAFLSVNRFAKK
jgi:sarcosine oxidase